MRVYPTDCNLSRFALQFTLFLCAALASAHGPMPINSKLGVPGFPDCVQPAAITDDVDANAHTLVCKQNEKDSDDQIAVGCIGDSITAGVHSSGGNHTYPGMRYDAYHDNVFGC